jgi:SAM-dependent methyltransferase
MNENNAKLPIDLSIRMDIIREFGYILNSESVIMDFGCGSGRKVKNFRDLGYQAYGCGTRFNIEDDIDTDAMMRNGIIRTIDLENYTLPFKDNTFDFIFSESVFEHVMNYTESICELARVLKPGGICLHTFVSRYKLIEAHVKVPLASFLQSYWWLYFWALLGRRNEWKDLHLIKERATRYYNYLKKETNYLTRLQLKNQFRRKFDKVVFCENLLLKYSPGRRKHLYPISKFMPFISHMFSAFSLRVIATQLPYKTNHSQDFGLPNS